MGKGEEDLCGLMESGEAALLQNKVEEPDHEEGLPLLQHQSCDWRAPLLVLVFELSESIAFFGVATSLVMYLTNVLHESNADAATHGATWMGTCYLMPLLGAFVCDSILGSYWTILFSASIYLLGMVAIAISSALPSPTAQPLLFYIALYVVALGSGGMKSAMLPLGAAQFDDNNPRDVEWKATFFSCFYMCITIGSLVASTSIVSIQAHVGWVVGYGIAASFIGVGFIGFVLGTPLFKKEVPCGSPLKSIIQVIVAAARRRKLEVPLDGSMLYKGDDGELAGQRRSTRIKQFSFLDKAATLDPNGQPPSNGNNDPWKLCTIAQVEDLKLLLGTFPIWLSSAVHIISLVQLSTTIVEQGNAMDTTVLSISIPPASLSAFEVLSVVSWSVFHDRIVSPIARRRTGNPRGLTLLQRIGVGRALMILAMGIAALTEHVRLEGVKARKDRLNIAWQLPTLFVIGGSEAMSFIGQLELFYEETPDGLKGLGMGLYLMSIAAGSYLSSLMVKVVQTVTTGGSSKGWIPEDLDEGHLDYFFWVLSGVCALNFVGHVLMSRNYVVRKVGSYLHANGN